MVQKLALAFAANPNEWIDGLVIARIAGSYAWRTRISDLRQAPYRMRIDNRQERHEIRDGAIRVTSYYRYVPDDPPVAGQTERGE
jgi:hypothetical protein